MGNKEQIQYNTKVFCEMLDVMEFKLVKQADGKYCLIDEQDAYLGDVDSYNDFENGKASAIVERLDTFLGDYYFDDLEEAAESEFGIDLSSDDAPVTAEEWVEFLDKHDDFKKDYMHEYEVMKLISSPEDIDLINLDDVVQDFPLHIGIIDCDHDPQYNETEHYINYYIAADDQTLRELTARTNLLQENEFECWQDMLEESDEYITMYVNAYSDRIDVFLDYNHNDYPVPLTAGETQRLTEAMKKAGMDIQQDLQFEAYKNYKDNWVEKNIQTIWGNGEPDNKELAENAISDIYQATYACFKESADPSVKKGEFKRGDCKILFSRENGAEDFAEVYYKSQPLCAIYKQGESFVIKPSTTDVSQKDLQKVKAAIDDTHGYNPSSDICKRKTEIELD